MSTKTCFLYLLLEEFMGSLGVYGFMRTLWVLEEFKGFSTFLHIFAVLVVFCIHFCIYHMLKLFIFFLADMTQIFFELSLKFTSTNKVP